MPILRILAHNVMVSSILYTRIVIVRSKLFDFCFPRRKRFETQVNVLAAALMLTVATELNLTVDNVIMTNRSVSAFLRMSPVDEVSHARRQRRHVHAAVPLPVPRLLPCCAHWHRMRMFASWAEVLQPCGLLAVVRSVKCLATGCHRLGPFLLHKGLMHQTLEQCHLGAGQCPVLAQ